MSLDVGRDVSTPVGVVNCEETLQCLHLTTCCAGRYWRRCRGVPLTVLSQKQEVQEVVLTCDGSLGFQDTFLVLAIDFKPSYPIFHAQLVQVRLALRFDGDFSICREAMQLDAKAALDSD